METCKGKSINNNPQMLSKYVDRNVLDLPYKRGDLMDLIERVQYKAGLCAGSVCWHGSFVSALHTLFNSSSHPSLQNTRHS